MSANTKKIIIITVSVLVVFGIILAIYLIPRDREYDEAEVKAAATALIKASEKLNEIYYGEGIRFLENSPNNKSTYCEADPEHLRSLGFTTINELKLMTKEVFSAAHAEGMFSGIFSGTGTSRMSRYYQEYDEIELVGLCTDICVISNAMLVKARFPEISVSVDAACCAGVTPASHANALAAMKMCQIEVLN